MHPQAEHVCLWALTPNAFDRWFSVELKCMSQPRVASEVSNEDCLVPLKPSMTIWICLLLFCGIATAFQFHGSDMMYEMRRRKPEPTLLLTQGTFNLPHHTGMV